MTEIQRRFLHFSDTQKGTKEGVIEEIPLSDSRADEMHGSGAERTASG